MADLHQWHRAWLTYISDTGQAWKPRTGRDRQSACLIGGHTSGHSQAEEHPYGPPRACLARETCDKPGPRHSHKIRSSLPMSHSDLPLGGTVDMYLGKPKAKRDLLNCILATLDKRTPKQTTTKQQKPGNDQTVKIQQLDFMWISHGLWCLRGDDHRAQGYVTVTLKVEAAVLKRGRP